MSKNIPIGPWWWSSGQRARLLLRRSEFESRWGLQFFCKIVVEKNENKQKRGWGWPIFKNKKKYTHYYSAVLVSINGTKIKSGCCIFKHSDWLKILCNQSECCKFCLYDLVNRNLSETRGRPSTWAGGNLEDILKQPIH